MKEIVPQIERVELSVLHTNTPLTEVTAVVLIIQGRRGEGLRWLVIVVVIVMMLVVAGVGAYGRRRSTTRTRGYK